MEFDEACGQPTEQDARTAEAEPAQQATPEGAVAVPEFQPSDPVGEEPAPVVAESPTGLPSEDASLASGWIVQVRSTPDKSSADLLQAALAVAGFPAFVVSAEVSGETYYRVRVGRYGSRDDPVRVEAPLTTRADLADPCVTGGCAPAASRTTPR